MAEIYDGFMSYSHAADGLLAPRLQAGLQRFAKPWWKRRAVRIFRDESSLSANPHLWSSITDALDTSGWFILLLSPDAARSEWVNQEIDYWVTHRNRHKILPVVTDGTFGWTNGDVDGDVVPPALAGVFAEEPRWVDLRFARDEDQLDLKNPRFSAAVADIASAVRGIPKDELESEEVKQHRRTTRTAWAAGALVTILAITAVGFGIQSAQNSEEAEHQRQLAEEEAERANANAALASSRELAASAIAAQGSDPELSILLALASMDGYAAEDAPTESMVALRSAMYADTLRERVSLETDTSPISAAVTTDGTAVVWASNDSLEVTRFDSASGAVVWTYDESHSPDCTEAVFISENASEVFVSVQNASEANFGCPVKPGSSDEAGSRILVLHLETGELLRSLEPGGCEWLRLGPLSPDRSALPIARAKLPTCDSEANGWTIELLDPESFDLIETLPFPGPPHFSWSDDSSRLAVGSFFGHGATVFDMTNGGREIVSIPDVYFAEISHDGTLIASGGFDTEAAVELRDVATGEVRDRLVGLTDPPYFFEFTSGDTRLVGASSGDRAAVWNLDDGRADVVMPTAGAAFGLGVVETDQLLLVGEDSVSSWDISGQHPGDGWARSLGGGFVYSIVSGDGVVSAGVNLGMDVQVMAIDPISLSWPEEAPSRIGAKDSPTLPDGRILYPQLLDVENALIGPVVAWNPDGDNADPVVGCEVSLSDLDSPGLSQRSGTCADGVTEYFAQDQIRVTPDGRRFVVSSDFGELAVFDSASLKMVAFHETGLLGQVKAFGGDWVAVSSTRSGVTADQEDLTIVELPSLEHEVVIDGRDLALSPDGSKLAVTTGPGTFTEYDTSTWEIEGTASFGESRITQIAYSPGNDFVMTVGSDGFIRVWDGTDLTETERIPIDDVSAAGWLDEERLLVGTYSGRLLTLVLDRSHVVDLARAGLSRTLSESECATYRLEPCPTSSELRGD